MTRNRSARAGTLCSKKRPSTAPPWMSTTGGPALLVVPDACRRSGRDRRLSSVLPRGQSKSKMPRPAENWSTRPHRRQIISTSLWLVMPQRESIRPCCRSNCVPSHSGQTELALEPAPRRFPRSSVHPPGRRPALAPTGVPRDLGRPMIDAPGPARRGSAMPYSPTAAMVGLIVARDRSTAPARSSRQPEPASLVEPQGVDVVVGRDQPETPNTASRDRRRPPPRPAPSQSPRAARGRRQGRELGLVRDRRGRSPVPRARRRSPIATMPASSGDRRAARRAARSSRMPQSSSIASMARAIGHACRADRSTVSLGPARRVGPRSPGSAATRVPAAPGPGCGPGSRRT